jgi:hypothetical protein
MLELKMTLNLPHVPEEHRAEIRDLLQPILARVTTPIEQGRCYELAHEIVALANDDRVRYVEGTWQRYLEPDGPMAHAWVTIDGFVVDLFEEEFILENGDENWIHSPATDTGKFGSAS